MTAPLIAPRTDAPPALSESLLRRFDTPGPRYTSYPTADRFGEHFGADLLTEALRLRGTAAGEPPAPLSVYVHIPFCESVCYYCACNKIVTRQHGRAAENLALLDAEIALVRAALGAPQPVSQLHLGGGSLTFLRDDELQRLMSALRGAFGVRPDAELSIEVDPRTVTPARLAHLRALGFNRLSFGVQDFDPAVQEAVHRVQPFDSVRALMDSARSLGFDSINADLIYGLPRQTPESLARTIGQIGALRPDRIALYAYAHLPQRFKPQRRIVDAELPPAAARVKMLGDAIVGLVGQGYDYIGMDHFALPGDALAVARREARLHRNFQGYSTQPECDLIGLGVSAIGRVGGVYSQNAKTLADYAAALGAGRLPVERGLSLDADDRLRRDVIMALMCQGRLDVAAIEAAHGIDFGAHFVKELEDLQPLADAGLVALGQDAVQVTATGWYVVRAVAMVFDAHLRRAARAAAPQARYSRVV